MTITLVDPAGLPKVDLYRQVAVATGSRLVFVAGRLTYRSWESRDGQRHRVAEVVATELVPLDRRPDADAGPADAAPREGGSPEDEPGDDLPF